MQKYKNMHCPLKCIIFNEVIAYPMNNRLGELRLDYPHSRIQAAPKFWEVEKWKLYNLLIE